MTIREFIDRAGIDRSGFVKVVLPDGRSFTAPVFDVRESELAGNLEYVQYDEDPRGWYSFGVRHRLYIVEAR